MSETMTVDRIEQTVRKRLLAQIKESVSDALEPDADLRDRLGLTSLDMVLLMTHLCDDLNVDLFTFTAEDIAAARTPQDIVQLFSRAGGQQSHD
jgi:acyl carrier protein